LQFFEVYIVVALVYWAVCIVIEQLVARLEIRVRPQAEARAA
jgi:L-cystine transport system permease protein